MSEEELRQDLVAYARRLVAGGLVRGTSGNLSARQPGADEFLVTPSGVDYDVMTPEDVVLVDPSGQPVGPHLKPSVDAPIHGALYRARPGLGGIVHTHSPYATAFASVGRKIPPLSAEAAGFLGGWVRALDYVPPARPDTGDLVARGLGQDRAVLLPNHGVIAVGEDLGKAFAAAMAVEEGAQLAFLVLQLGNPRQVPDSEIARMNEFIHQHYGQR